MKLIHTITVALFASCSIVVATEQPAVMRFINNDQITGQLQSISASHLEWSSSALAEPASFPVHQVLDLTLPDTDQPPASEHTASLTMKNGDIIRGQLVAVEDDNIVIDTWYAGKLTLNRPMVSTITIENTQTNRYMGPSSMDGWKLSDEKEAPWIYLRQAFISNGRGSIGRNNVLPTECSVAFDVEWKSDNINLKVVLFAEKPEDPQMSGGYELSFQNSNISLRTNSRKSVFFGRARSNDFLENTKAHIEIRASRSTGRVALLINGTMVESWPDPQQGKDATGSCLHFISNSSNEKHRISRIKVSSWDGKFDEMPIPMLMQNEQPSPTEELASDRIQLANGDSLKGLVTAVQDGDISVKTELGDVQLPIERFRTLNLPGLGKEQSIRRNGDIRAHFSDGSSIVFRLDSTDGNTITGSSQNFGSASFNLSSIQQVEFNLYNLDIQQLRKKQRW